MGNHELDALKRGLADLLGASVTPGIPFDKLCDFYMTTYARARKKTWKQDEDRIRLYMIQVFQNRDITTIKRPEIAAWHAQIGATAPYAANRALEQLAKMFKEAQIWGHFPETYKLPTEGIKPFPEKSRDDFVHQGKELERLALAINSCRVKKYRVLFWLYLMTGLRRCELLNSKWQDLDLERRELRIPDTKNGKPHYVPLSNEALALLDSLPRRGKYIFPGGNPNRPLNTSTVWNAWNRIRRRAALDHIRIHDLRRTFASHLAQAGCPLQLIGKLLNHSGTESTKIYARFADTDRREVVIDYAAKLNPLIDSSA